jgi:hypothetical protein
VLSAALVLALAGAVVYNLPQSHLRDELYPKTQPYMNAVGLDQNWGVFAPDPRKQVLGFEARINYPTGGSDIWRPPVRGRLIGSYSDYRWQKWFDNAITQGQSRGFLPSGARWVARTQRSGSEIPATVTFNKRYADLQPPGKGGGHPPLAEAEIFEQPIRQQDIRDGN